MEDDGVTRELLCRLLENEGWTVSAAENGRVALECLATDQPELILLDLMMPEMDGFEFTPTTSLTYKRLNMKEIYHF